MVELIPNEVRDLSFRKSMKTYYVYIMSSLRGVLYIGVTSDLLKRAYEHKNNLIEGFTKKYNVKNLIYYEVYEDVTNAIEREKQLKKWRREKKLWLVDRINPTHEDLYETIR